MAQRPVFIPQFDTNDEAFVLTKNVEFMWVPGMAFTQRQKSMDSLHSSALQLPGLNNILEVSSKSREKLGVSLSAFNLMIDNAELEQTYSVESAFQSSKVFQDGGPFTELLYKNSREAKRDPRLRESGYLTKFSYLDEDWPIEPQTAFYDWLYIQALRNQSNPIKDKIFEYDAFTDIEFNPKKSINCQAYSLSLYVSLHRRGRLEDAMKSKADFIECVKSASINNIKQNDTIQKSLF